MTKKKTKRNATGSQGGGFKISKNPRVLIPDDASFFTVDAPVHGEPVLFAIARDPHTIFASWNVDWRAVFEKAMPADRQVHLRLIDDGGAVKMTVPIEPMSEMHYLTTSGLHGSYRLELGYFQPFSSWHSVVTSAEVHMSPHRNLALSDVDLATIPFHLSFQQLADLLGTGNDTPAAKVISKYQKRLLNSEAPNERTASDTKILGTLKLSVREIAAAERDYKNTDNKKLARHARARVRIAATSPVRGFQANGDS